MKFQRVVPSGVSRTSPSASVSSAAAGQAGKRIAGLSVQAEVDGIITLVETTFRVPSKPVNDHGQLIYFWPGADNPFHGGILQPVIGWHTGSYFMHNTGTEDKAQAGVGEYVQGKQIPMQPGTEVTGRIELLSRTDSPAAYQYKVSMVGYPEETSVTVTWPVPATRVLEYIEAYDCAVEDDYPADKQLVWKNIRVETDKGPVSTLNWQLSGGGIPDVQFCTVTDDSGTQGEVVATLRREA